MNDFLKVNFSICSLGLSWNALNSLQVGLQASVYINKKNVLQERCVALFLEMLHIQTHSVNRKHQSSVAVQLLLVRTTVTYQRLLYNRLFRGRCLTTGLHAIVLYIESRVYFFGTVGSCSGKALKFCLIDTRSESVLD
jgi:hypothetical protein